MLKYNRNNLNEFLINNGQNKIGQNLKTMINEIDQINNINDIAKLWQYLHKQFKRDINHTIPKFKRTSEEIATSKIWSGCSDIGTVFAPILREKGIPTIYLQSAKIDWVEKLNINSQDCITVEGHIFLEIYISNEWILFDPTNGYLYLDYDYNNLSLPDNYYVFSKSLNGHEIDFDSLEKNNIKMTQLFKNFDLNNYKRPNYPRIDLRNSL